MSERLKSVISKLYRPHPQRRQVITLSQADAERLPPLPNVAIISITSPERTPAAIEGFDFLLRLAFEDVNFLDPELSSRAKEKLPGSFTSAQATRIRDFVENLPQTVRTIVVHCAGGFSRSAAVAVSLHRIYGYEVEEEHLRKANDSVIQVLTGVTSCNPKRRPRR